MPIPAPGKEETREKFVSRCMSNSVMKSEFPENKQRLAVCFSKWKEHKKKKESSQESLPEDTVEKLIEAFLEKHPEIGGIE